MSRTQELVWRPAFNNDKYIRRWWEVSCESMRTACSTRAEAKESGARWFPLAKGGDYRRWFGNITHLVNWENDGHELRTTPHPSGTRIWAHNFNLSRIFSEGITWSAVSSAYFGVRLLPQGCLFGSGGSSAFCDSYPPLVVLAFTQLEAGNDIYASVLTDVEFRGR